MKRLFLLGIFSLSIFTLNAEDQVVLIGQLNEIIIKEVILQTKSASAVDEPESRTVEIKEDRTFKLNLSLPPSQQFELKIGALNLPLYLEPGDSLIVSLESVNDQLVVKYDGKGSANNTFLFQYSMFEKKLAYGDLEGALQRKDGQAYWDAVEKLNRIKQGYFEQYVERSKKPLSDGFRSFMDNQINYKQADWLLAFYNHYRSVINLKVVELPEEYTAYLEELTLADDEAITSPSYQSALLSWVNFKNTASYGSFIEDELKKFADRYKIAGDELSGASEYYTKYAILKGLLKADFVYAAYEYEDFMKSTAPQFLKEPLIRIHQIKSMKLEGLPMPDIKLLDEEGTSKRLSDFQGQIQYLCLWKNDESTEKDLSTYFRLFGKKVTQDSLVKFQLIYTAKNPNIWKQVLKGQKRTLDFFNHYRLDLSDELTRNFVLRTDDYGPLFILVDKEGMVAKDNAGMSYEYNPNSKIRRLLKADQ
ncbi:MAG: hypothetical protein HRU41_28070 [Saprospiraceae bacterium]|nr:hypothetical protein [Saprospiraceae bacterium]